MKHLALLAAAFLALLLALPLMAAAFVAPSPPAVAQEVACTTIAAPALGPWRPPFQQQYTATSPFGPRVDPISGAATVHTGQDLASLPGPGPVVAAAAGTVTVGFDASGLGNFVTIEHGGGVSTRYGHLASIAPGIATGATMWMGQQIGIEGSTGHSTGNHLHFEIRVNGTAIDPVPFMLEHGAPLTGRAIAASPPPGRDITDPSTRHVGNRFELPRASEPRLNSLTNPPLPIPAGIKAVYVAAAERYHLPWTLLAGIGMEETAHGHNNTTSSAGAQGLMQFMPTTWATYGVDGSGDGRADIHNDGDSAMSAANYLTAAGVASGDADGIRRAIFAYNHADWYVNDVLYYATAYGGGIIPGNPSDCRSAGSGMRAYLPSTHKPQGQGQPQLW